MRTRPSPRRPPCVSDLTVDQDELPPEIATQPAAWAGCVSGALAEEDFVRKLERAGFAGAKVLDREPLGVDDCALYPLFTDEVIGLMRTLIPPERQPWVAVSVVVRANLPAGRASESPPGRSARGWPPDGTRPGLAVR